MTSSLDRRRFLLGSGFFSTQYSALTSAALSLASSLSLAEPHHHDSTALATLQATEAAGLQAVAARILPEDESGPGAISGGVIYFIDQVLGSSRAEWLGLLREGLLELDAQAGSYGKNGFAALDEKQQYELLLAVEDTDFFVTMRTLTMAGMFALPDYGGNRDHAGYVLIGFGHQHVWQPPFGHYDADYMARGE
ncbi:MAG: gluconate 2-dehydrogenase subunit 3 family protein [Pseudohongiellaceae bacterium]